jgi:hypothetical protein
MADVLMSNRSRWSQTVEHASSAAGYVSRLNGAIAADDPLPLHEYTLQSSNQGKNAAKQAGAAMGGPRAPPISLHSSSMLGVTAEPQAHVRGGAPGAGPQ